MTQPQMDYKRGLSSAEASQRLAKQGKNVTTGGKKSSFVKKFFSQFGDLMIIILLVAAALSFGLALYSGEKADMLEPVIIVAIVLANAFLGAFQEYRAEKSLDALKKLTSPKTKVVRDGNVILLDSENVVVDDVCVFEAGDVVTADCKLLNCESFFVNQSALTGESTPVEKRQSSSHGKRSDTIYSGSFVTNGRCTAQVTATGSNTELGKIANFLADSKAVLTPLQQKLKQLSKVIGIVCLSVCFVVLVVGFVKGVRAMKPGDTLTAVFVNIFLTSVSLAVAAIPEGLPAVVTVVLAKGIEKMAAKSAVVKRLTAVEALGSATVICSDKTGTLTQNKMSLVGMYDGKSYRRAAQIPQEDANFQAFCWCCDVVKNDEGWLGDPTEVAVASLMQKPNFALRLFEIPFDSNRKLMTVVVKHNNRYFAVTKGSFDAMKNACNYDVFQKHYNVYAKKGLRVLALSVKEVRHDFSKSLALENSLNITALFTLADPPRKEVFRAVEMCKSAGIRPVMITGDSLLTAQEIAKNLGILQQGDMAVDGETLQSWSDSQLARNVGKIAVYARVTPSDKLRIVNAWKSVNAVVAMTGDGVNDAPALKNADIGCAMGSGTEVAKDASDIILADDNFATIVDAVSLGRSVYQNIKKAVTYLLTCNIGEVLSVFVALLIWDVSPLSAMQLLWINLVTDGLPGLALGIYKQEDDVMKIPPKKAGETFFSGGGGRRIVLGGILFALSTLLGYAVGNSADSASASTMAYLILSLSQLIFVLEIRSRHSIFRGGITAFMAVSFAVSVVMVFAVALVPALQGLFGLTQLPWQMYLAALALSTLPSLARECYHLFYFLKKKAVK